MKSRCLYPLIAAVCLCIVGCQQPEPENWLLVSFEKKTPVTYQFTSERQITIDLTGGSSAKKNKPQTVSEKLEMVITYMPTRVDPFGLSTLTATCQSAKVTRSSISNKNVSKDAIEYLAGESFTFKISPTGEIVDDTDMRRIVRQIGEKAFAQGQNSSRRIKNPDMISDFIVMQWNLWDVISSIEEPLAGVQAGQTWETRKWIPWAIPLANLPSRLTTYELDHFLPDPNGPADQDRTRKAVITSTSALAEPLKKSFPKAYEGSFQMRGIMGFLRNYEFLSLEGTGTQVFNMDKGLIESDRQHYTMNVNAAFMLPLGDSLPVLTVDQTISIEHIKTP